MIALHMLVKDEQELLPKLLAQVKPYVSEMVIVVDASSTDGTKAIALAHGATVVTHDLDHDFAAARNAGLEQVTQPWVLWLDGDESLSPELKGWLERFLENPPLTCDAVAIRRHNLIDNKPIGDHTYEWHIRLFRRHLRCEGRIHERINVLDHLSGAAPGNCMIFHHKTQKRQDVRNEQYMEWPEQRAIVGG